MVYKKLIWKQFVALRSPLRKLNFWSTPPLWRRHMFIYPINLSAVCLIKNFTRSIEEIRRRFLEKLMFNPFYETIFHSHFHIYPLLQLWKKINIKAAMYSNNKKDDFLLKERCMLHVLHQKKTYNQDILSFSHQRDILNVQSPWSLKK